MSRSLADLQTIAVSFNTIESQSVDPAAGIEISQIVPAGQVWRLYAVRFTFVTSAVVANRVPNLLLDDGSGNAFVKISADNSQPASTTRGYSFAQGFPYATKNEVLGPLPSPCDLPAGYRIRTVTDLLDPGDNYSSAVIFAEVELV